MCHFEIQEGYWNPIMIERSKMKNEHFQSYDEYVERQVRHREGAVQLKGSGDVGKYIYYVFRKKGTE